MTAIHRTHDADPAAIDGSRIAIVGYGDAGSAWARNLRDGGHEVIVCTRPGPSAERAAIDGFAHRPIAAAAAADIVCLLVPDGVIATLGLDPAGWALTVVSSGEVLASGRVDPNGDVAMLSPKAHPREVRRRFVDGGSVPSAIAVHHDRTGRARQRTVALADAVGALGGGAVEMSPWQDALLTRSVAQTLRPEMETVCATFVQTLIGHGVPLDAIITGLVADRGTPCGARSADDGRWQRDGDGLRRVVADLAAGHLDRGLDAWGGPDLGPLLDAHDLDRAALAADLRCRLEAEVP